MFYWYRLSIIVILRYKLQFLISFFLKLSVLSSKINVTFGRGLRLILVPKMVPAVFFVYFLSSNQNAPIRKNIHCLKDDNWASSRENLSSGPPKKVRFKQACPATETSLKYEILLVVSLDIILSNKRVTNAYQTARKTGFLSTSSIFNIITQFADRETICA